MPELTARNIAFMALMAATVAAVLAAVVLLARQDNNAPIRIIAPDSQHTTPDGTNMQPVQTHVQDGLIDLNRASVELLDTLPGKGPALAEAIVSYRENVWPFQSVEEITEVPKIGPVTYLNIGDLVTVPGVR